MAQKLEVGHKVMRSPKIWKDPKHHWVGKIIRIERSDRGETLHIVDFNRTSINEFTGKKEKTRPTCWMASELVRV